jgi:hypothetical protein
MMTGEGCEMARKAKKRVHPMPKLGWKDLLLYWGLMILGYGGCFATLLFPLFYCGVVAARNPDMIAYSGGDGILYSFWLAIWLLIFGVIVTAGFYEPRRPIFGRSDIKYGPPAYPRIYPLLMKNKPKFWQSSKKLAQKKMERTILVVVLLATLLLGIVLYPHSLYARQELLYDGSVVFYDTCNQELAHYRQRDMESVSLDAERSGGKNPHWYARFAFAFTDGKECSFSVYSLGDDWSDAIRTAEGLKARYGNLVAITDADDLWKVVMDQDLTPTEEEMLYRLFETKKER